MRTKRLYAVLCCTPSAEYSYVGDNTLMRLGIAVDVAEEGGIATAGDIRVLHELSWDTRANKYEIIRHLERRPMPEAKAPAPATQPDMEILGHGQVRPIPQPTEADVSRYLTYAYAFLSAERTFQHSALDNPALPGAPNSDPRNYYAAMRGWADAQAGDPPLTLAHLTAILAEEFPAT